MQSERETIVALSRVIADQAARLDTELQVRRSLEQQVKQQDDALNRMRTKAAHLIQYVHMAGAL